MSYCEICDSNLCTGAHSFNYERCAWCGEIGVFRDDLCRPCYFSESHRHEESINPRRHCKNCGRDYLRTAFHVRPAGRIHLRVKVPYDPGRGNR